MAETVRLTLEGRQTAETGEETVTKSVLSAEYYERGGSVYILYEEPGEDGDAAVKNCIKLKPPAVEIIKKGPVNARMVFEPGREHLTDYVTPFGCLKIGILTETAEVSRSEKGTEIFLSYALTTQGIPFSRCAMSIAAKHIDL